MKFSTLALHCVLLCVMILNCAPEELTYTVEMIDGTRVVHNLSPAWGDEQKITLNLIRTLGDVDIENDENYQFFGPVEVQIDEDDNIYILESRGKTIKKYDKEFKYITTIGKEGTGPGEFRIPQHFEIKPENRMYVYDMGNQRIEIMTLDGEYIESIRMLMTNSPVFRLNSGSYVKVVGQRPFKPLQDDEMNTLIHIYDSEGTETNVFGKMRKYEEINMAVYGNAAQITHDRDDNIYTAMRSQNRIEKYTPSGDLLLKISRELPYEEGTVMINFEDNSRAPSFSQSIIIDEKRRIWVQTYSAQMTTEEWEKDDPFQYFQSMLEVFDETGVLLTRIKSIPSGDYLMSLIHNNRIYFTSSSVKMDVKIFEIVEK